MRPPPGQAARCDRVQGEGSGPRSVPGPVVAPRKPTDWPRGQRPQEAAFGVAFLGSTGQALVPCTGRGQLPPPVSAWGDGPRCGPRASGHSCWLSPPASTPLQSGRGGTRHGPRSTRPAGSDLHDSKALSVALRSALFPGVVLGRPLKLSSRLSTFLSNKMSWVAVTLGYHPLPILQGHTEVLTTMRSTGRGPILGTLRGDVGSFCPHGSPQPGRTAQQSPQLSPGRPCNPAAAV